MVLKRCSKPSQVAMPQCPRLGYANMGRELKLSIRNAKQESGQELTFFSSRGMNNFYFAFFF